MINDYKHAVYRRQILNSRYGCLYRLFIQTYVYELAILTQRDVKKPFLHFVGTRRLILRGVPQLFYATFLGFNTRGLSYCHRLSRDD